MRLTLFSLLFNVLIVSCKEVGYRPKTLQEDMNDRISVIEREAQKGINADTVLLGFVLTESKQKAMHRVDSLISVGKLGKNVRDFTIWNSEGEYLKFEFEGYPYKIHLNATDSFTSYISLHFFNNRLRRIDLSVRELPPHEDLLNFLSSIYGDPNYISINGMYHWIRGEREIELTKGFVPIVFSSLKSDPLLDSAFTRFEDSLLSINPEAMVDSSRADFR